VTSTNIQHGLQPHPHVEEEFVTSADGTRIGFRRLGQGPAVVFVHGSVSTHTDWMPAAKILSQRFTCFVMDRRGRRGSGHGHGPYTIEQEYADVRVLLEVAGPEAMLAGHSYGAACAMGAALLRPVPKLVLYEPPLSVGGPVAEAEPLAAYAAAVEAGENEHAMEIGLTRFTRLRPEVLAAIRSSKGWPRLCHLAPTWTRELIAMNAATSVEPYAALRCPVLLLEGAISPEHPYKDSARALAAMLPDLRLAALEGQDHLGLRGAPEDVARLLGEFLAG
jgi:pimeloyl-ACP methyl ester carboxylesterase